MQEVSQMKKLFILFFVLFVVLSVVFFQKSQKIQDGSGSIPEAVAPSPTTGAELPKKAYLFVPYWSFSKSVDQVEDFDSFIYFGITPTTTGINTSEAGYKKLFAFSQLNLNQKEKLLAVRMTDSKTNFSILENNAVRSKVIAESIALAKQYGFNGIVLNLELSSLPFQSVITEINEFSNEFYNESSKNELSFYTTVYGDVFYRIRPFDVKELAKNSDGIFIMAYDFHKANGNPGPNFPFLEKSIYGYDFRSMITDFLKFTTPQKITVVFGMYGYDWPVDEKRNGESAGTSLSINDIEKKFFPLCVQTNCKISKNEALETSIFYTDITGQNHIVWFEDETSVEKKIKFLNEKHINSTAFWAYSYF